MADYEVLKGVQDRETRGDRLSHFLENLKQHVIVALGGTLPPDTQVRVDTAFAEAHANKHLIDVALNGGAPVEEVVSETTTEPVAVKKSPKAEIDPATMKPFKKDEGLATF